MNYVTSQSIDSSREDLLEAMVWVVGAKGYGATSVSDVLEEAGASYSTFYTHFEGKHECFLAAYEALVGRARVAVTRNSRADRPWLERVIGGLETVVRLCTANPELARTALVEVAAAGADARRLHWEAIVSFAEGMQRGRDLPGQAELPANVALMSVGGVAGLIADELLAGGAAELPKRLPDLTFALLVPYLGPHSAAEEMWRTAPRQAQLGREKVATEMRREHRN